MRGVRCGVFSVCIGEAATSDPRVPCGVAYPGIPTLALHLAAGPPATHGETKQHELPKQPAVLLSTTASAGVEGASGFVDNLFYRAWQAQGNGDCVSIPSGSSRWGAGPVAYFARSTASVHLTTTHSSKIT